MAYELYLAALRDPALRSVTESWTRTLATTPGASRAATREIIARRLGAAG